MAVKPEDLKMSHEDDPRVIAERYLNRSVLRVRQLEAELRQAKSDERRARAEVGELDIKGRDRGPNGHRP